MKVRLWDLPQEILRDLVTLKRLQDPSRVSWVLTGWAPKQLLGDAKGGVLGGNDIADRSVPWWKRRPTSQLGDADVGRGECILLEQDVIFKVAK